MDVVVVGAMVASEDGDEVCVDGVIPVTVTALNELIGEIACQPYCACAHLWGHS